MRQSCRRFAKKYKVSKSSKGNVSKDLKLECDPAVLAPFTGQKEEVLSRDEIEKKVEELETKIDDLQSTLDDLRPDEYALEELDEKLNSVQEKIDSLDSEKDGEEVGKLEEEREKIEQEKEEVERAPDKEREKLEKDLDALGKQKESLQKTVDRITTDGVVLTGKLFPIHNYKNVLYFPEEAGSAGVQFDGVGGSFQTYESAGGGESDRDYSSMSIPQIKSAVNGKGSQGVDVAVVVKIDARDMSSYVAPEGKADRKDGWLCYKIPRDWKFKVYVRSGSRAHEEIELARSEGIEVTLQGSAYQHVGAATKGTAAIVVDSAETEEDE